MRELNRALADIHAIRFQVARGAKFRGYGPLSIALTGCMALCVAAGESRWLPTSGADLKTFLAIWVSTAALAVTLSALETVFRARRVHSDLAVEMIHAAVEQFLPCVVVAILLTVVLLRVAPQESWMCPGLWELTFSLGIFASCRFLPPQMFLVGAWYLGAGLLCLVVGSSHHSLSAWEMGIPFGIGQLLVAAVLQFGFEDAVEEN
jgi:hypothetical protein